MNNNIISKILSQKTGAYLKISILLFLFSLILLSSTFTFIQYQYQQIESDFIKNKNTHLIEITSVIDKNNPNKVIPLLFKDEMKISKLVLEEAIYGTMTYSEYMINFGILDNNDTPYFIRGIDELALDSLELPNLSNNNAFSSQEVGQQNILLRYPVIKIEEGGFSSSKLAEAEMLLTPINTSIPPLNILDTYSDTLFVNKSMFQNIIESMYQIKWDIFIEKYDNGENFGIQAINRIFVYVEKLSDIKNVARTLENNGYSIRYTLGAFDDISKSINSNYFLMTLMLFFIYLVTAINVVISFRGYIMSMQKDMGILLHYGYSRNRVYYIYKRVILRPFIFLFSILVIYTFIISSFIFGNSFIIHSFITIVFLFFIVSSVIVTILYMLRRIIKKDILYLLKTSKEIE